VTARHPAYARARGFTLIEMMTVLAIVGIMTQMVMSVSSRPVGANARVVSDQVVSAINFAKLRAQATRAVHRVRIEPQKLTILAGTVTGLATPATWSVIQESTIPKRSTIWNVSSSSVVTTGASVAANASLSYNLDVRPDRQATASTVYITDGKANWRVIVYRITGGAYARIQW
jgi:prepilin-type N-terminal cleavage/methylation domain-containing protein